MGTQLNKSIVVQRLAADLKLKPSSDPVASILSKCHSVVKDALRDHSACTTPGELLTFLANKLGTRFVEIHSDQDLRNLIAEYVERGELMFATLETEFKGTVTDAITIRLLRAPAWELPFVSVVDCRGYKRFKSYHSKWHELGHLLIQTDQGRLAYRRTHDPGIPKSAEESLVDVIAGEFSFYPPMIRPQLIGEISFQKVEAIRGELCPEASHYSAFANIAKLWHQPCVWLEAKMGLKKQDRDNGQGRLSFYKAPAPQLRAVHTNSNEAAKEIGLVVIPNFRVPESSVIARVHHAKLTAGEAHENLSAWESSSGTSLADINVRVQARRVGETVHAFITPLP
jgi:hypothetical protein